MSKILNDKYFESELQEIDSKLKTVLNETELEELIQGIQEGLLVLERLGIEPADVSLKSKSPAASPRLKK